MHEILYTSMLLSPIPVEFRHFFLCHSLNWVRLEHRNPVTFLRTSQSRYTSRTICHYQSDTARCLDQELEACRSSARELFSE